MDLWVHGSGSYIRGQSFLLWEQVFYPRMEFLTVGVGVICKDRVFNGSQPFCWGEKKKETKKKITCIGLDLNSVSDLWAVPDFLV